MPARTRFPADCVEPDETDSVTANDRIMIAILMSIEMDIFISLIELVGE